MSSTTELQAWLNGTPTGGPNNDGRYPLTAKDDTVFLVYCPAAQALNPALSELPVELYEQQAQEAAQNAEDAASDAVSSKNAAAGSASAAASSASAASSSASAAAGSASAAAGSASAASGSASTASSAASTATGAAAAANNSALLAELWASEDEDTVVAGGKYSAYHWAEKAAASAAAVGGSIAQATVLGRAAGSGTGSPIALTAAQVRTILNVADGATAGATWGTNLASIPANITSWAGIAPSAKQDTLGFTPWGPTTLGSVGQGSADCNSVTTHCDRSWASDTTANRPGDWYSVYTFTNTAWGNTHRLQLAHFGGDTQDYKVRHWSEQGGGNWRPWRSVFHEGNFNPASKQDALGFTPVNSEVSGSNANSVGGRSFGVLFDPSTNTPTGSWTQILTNHSSQWGYQLAQPWFEDNLYLRTNSNTTWGTWKKLWHSGNFNPATKLDARVSLGVNAGYPAGGDWNNAIDNGWYMGDGLTNAPSGGWWIGLVTAHNPLWLEQEVIAFTDGGVFPRRYRRYKRNGAWTGWHGVSDIIVSATDPGGADGTVWVQP